MTSSDPHHGMKSKYPGKTTMHLVRIRGLLSLRFLSGILSDILSGSLSGILSGILSDIGTLGGDTRI